MFPCFSANGLGLRTVHSQSIMGKKNHLFSSLNSFMVVYLMALCRSYYRPAKSVQFMASSGLQTQLQVAGVS